MNYAYFKDLPLKTLFSFDGYKCIKKSNKTANFVELNHWCYFGMNDICRVNDYCQLPSNYNID